MMNNIGKTLSMEELADKLAITEIIHAYSRGVDRADSEILKSTCWEDAEVDYGGYQGLAHPFCESLPTAIKNYKNTQHQVSNTLIFLDDPNNASVESYVTAHHLRPDNTEMTYIGRYLDKMEKRSGFWKIKFRKIVMTWHQDFSSTEDFEKNVSLVPISRATNNGEDTSYDFFRK